MNNNKVVKLNTVSNSILETLEDLIDRVNKNNIDAFAVAAITRDGCVITHSCCGREIYTLLGAVGSLRVDIEGEIE